MSGFDIIGDVHGEGTKLVGLLELLGYEKRRGTYSHPHRQAIFVGDLIDRGNQQADVLKIVRNMYDAGAAQIVMGNHEFNAIAYATEDHKNPGHFMREHSEKNNQQHKKFLEQFTPEQRVELVSWFKSLPLWLNLDGFRVVHACWHEESVREVERALGGGELSQDDFFVEAARKGTHLYRAVEILLKGPELRLASYGLPPFLDKGDHARPEARIRWWNSEGRMLKDVAEIQPGARSASGLEYPPFEDLVCAEQELVFTYQSEKPVFYGHYWRSWPPEEGLDWTDKTASVDFSAGAGGPLVAYRWNGETSLTESNYVAYPEIAQKRKLNS